MEDINILTTQLFKFVCSCNLSSYFVVISLPLSLKAIETLKGFEKKDSKVQSTAATNLSFLYFLVSIRSVAVRFVFVT